MTRATGTGPHGPEFEIELTRPDGTRDDHEPESAGSPQPTNWRRVVAVASIAGAVLGIGIGIGVLAVQASDDDEASSGADTTVDAGSLASSITTPPTLSPLAELPAVDAVPDPPTDIPTATSSQNRSLFDQVTVPAYERYVGDPPAGGFDLVAAVTNLANGLPRRSSTHLELGVAGFVRDYTIVHDATNDRYRITVDDASGATSIAVLDQSRNVLLWDASSTGAGEQWIPVDASAQADQFGVESLSLFFDRLLAGPVRGDSLGGADMTPGEMFVLEDASLARSYEVVVDGAAIPEWQIYALGPASEFLPTDRPTRMTYTVYVDETSEIRRVVGVSDLDGIPQLIVHDIEQLAAPVTIVLPDPDTIDSDPAQPG